MEIIGWHCHSKVVAVATICFPLGLVSSGNIWQILVVTGCRQYDTSFLITDAAAILYDEQTKKPCRKFLQTGKDNKDIMNILMKDPYNYRCVMLLFLSFASGQCVFGNNCRFSHMSERDMENLRMQIEGKLFPQDGTVCHGHGPQIKGIQLWAMASSSF